MSNVLVGIIGVILFIGLALAGALLLGNDFMTASATTQGAVLSSQLQQLSQAYLGMKMRRGITLQADVNGNLAQTLINNKALAGMPTNPVMTANSYLTADAAGTVGSTNELGVIFTRLGQSAKAKDICYSIEETAGNTNPSAAVDTNLTFSVRLAQAPRLGCMRSWNMGNEFVAYITV
jgi:hypothetical protein